MRVIALVLCILGSLASVPVYADCTHALSTAVYSQYAFGELGQVFYDKPVLQSDAALTCDDMTYDLWNSTQFSGPGAYGHRGAGDEVDLTGTFNHTYETSFGPIAVEVSAAYWLVDNFSLTKDDWLAFHEQVGRPFQVGSATIMPYVRINEWESFNGNSVLLVRPGVVVSFPVAEGWSFSIDGSEAVDLQQRRNILNANASLTHDLGGGWSAFSSVTVAQQMPPVFGGGLRFTF
jgi:hypothetical protein